MHIGKDEALSEEYERLPIDEKHGFTGLTWGLVKEYAGDIRIIEQEKIIALYKKKARDEIIDTSPKRKTIPLCEEVRTDVMGNMTKISFYKNCWLSFESSDDFLMYSLREGYQRIWKDHEHGLSDIVEFEKEVDSYTELGYIVETKVIALYQKSMFK